VGDEVTYSDSSTEDISGVIRAAKCENELSDTCKRIGKFFGLPYFSAMRLPVDGTESLRNLEMFSNWPASLIADYDRHNLLKCSPVIARLKVSTDPIVFSIDKINNNRADRQDNLAKSLFHRHGIRAGMHFSVHRADGTLGTVSFVGPEETKSVTQIAKLNCIANAIFSKTASFKNNDQTRPFGLTKREVDCLDWASQGKTSGEMSQILGLSEHTVNHYLINASRKLDATSRVHTVSKALRLGVIQ